MAKNLESCERCQDILRFIASYKQEHDGNSPTVRAIASAVGLSASVVQETHIVNHLLSWGFIRATAPIELTEKAWEWIGDHSSS